MAVEPLFGSKAVSPCLTPFRPFLACLAAFHVTFRGRLSVHTTLTQHDEKSLDMVFVLADSAA